ncbi:MAG TPA: carbon storage regulator [Gemmataceae bacterium]|jgi:carbon storage regulator
MLVLSRKLGEQIIVGDNIRVTVVSISGGRVRLGFAAPAEVRILRQEMVASAHRIAGPVVLEGGAPS